MSHRLDLSLALSDNARTRPIIDGRATARDIHLRGMVLHPSEMFWRQLHHAEFDVSEMSIAALLIGLSRGRDEWAALPVFTSRKFFHTSVLVRRDAGIEVPADLAGKRVGVPEYQQTWAVWSRGVLQEEYGVRPESIEWHMERGQDRSHAAATGFKPPEGVVIRQIPPTTDMGEMLIKGELDATLLYLNSPNLVDRSKIDVAKSELVKTLFPDPWAEGLRYYAKTGVFPVNHTVVVRRSLLAANPWIASSVFEAFVEAKRLSEAEARAGLSPSMDEGMPPGPDPMPYGVEPNRKVIETVARYAQEQGLTDRLVSVDEVFAPGILDT